MEKQETFLLTGEKDSITSVASEIIRVGQNNPQVFERKNLDGEAATWIVVTTLTVQALPHILTFIKDMARSNKITKIKIGDFEVENPTQEIIEQAIKLNKQKLNDTENEPTK
jgi:hypothetical protein